MTSIDITGYGFVKDPRVPEYVVFLITVVQPPAAGWTIYRRYSSFLSLGEQLAQFIPGIPACPPKRVFNSQSAEQFEKARQEHLLWLQQVLRIPAAAQSKQVHDFLTTEANMPPHGIHPGIVLQHGVGMQHQADLDEDTEDMGEMDMNEMFSNSLEEENQMSGGMSDGEDLEEEDADSGSQVDNRKVVLDDFILLKVIGKGSFGKVMQVRMKTDGKIYAMKVLKKENIIKRNQVEHTRTERQVLGYIRHPFIVGLNYAFQTKEKLYFVLDYCAGGELFFHLGKLGKFPEHRACCYAAQITLALQYIHELDVIYRDLKPENVLLNDKGNVMLTDFGLSKEGIHSNFSGAHSFCGTPEYLAPEILNRAGHGRAVDWWSLGALLYEMLTGLPPFYCRDRERLFDKIRRADLTYPKYLSIAARAVLQGLLTRDPTKRLGTGPQDADEIKQHGFFSSIDFEGMISGTVPAPWQPTVVGSLDTSQFDKEFTSMPIISPPQQDSRIRADDKTFEGFTFVEESQIARHCGSQRSMES